MVRYGGAYWTQMESAWQGRLAGPGEGRERKCGGRAAVLLPVLAALGETLRHLLCRKDFGEDAFPSDSDPRLRPCHAVCGVVGQGHVGAGNAGCASGPGDCADWRASQCVWSRQHAACHSSMPHLVSALMCACHSAANQRRSPPRLRAWDTRPWHLFVALALQMS